MCCFIAVAALTARIMNTHAPPSPLCPTEQMEKLSAMPPVEGQELLQGAVLMVWKSRRLPSVRPASPTPPLNSQNRRQLTAHCTERIKHLFQGWKCESGLVPSYRARLTSRGLSLFAWGARLPLVGVGRAVKLRRAHVEEQSFLEVVHHSQTATVSKHHTETQEGRGTQWSQDLDAIFTFNPSNSATEKVRPTLMMISFLGLFSNASYP